MPLNRPEDKLIIIFDNHCVMCNSFVKFIAHRDKNDKIRFAERSQQTEPLETMIVRYKGKEYYQNHAVIIILKELKSFYSLIGNILSFVPQKLGNKIYSVVAKNRSKIFGRTVSCNYTEEVRRRLIHLSLDRVK